MVLSSDPTLLRRPRFPAPTSKEPSVRAATPLPTLLGSRAGDQAWAPPGDRHPYSLSPIEEGEVKRSTGGGGGARRGKDGEGGEKRWCWRDRRGKRGEVEQQERGATTEAPRHTPWPKPWAPPVLTGLPRPPVAWRPGLWIKAGCVCVCVAAADKAGSQGEAERTPGPKSSQPGQGPSRLACVREVSQGTAECTPFEPIACPIRVLQAAAGQRAIHRLLGPSGLGGVRPHHTFLLLQLRWVTGWEMGSEGQEQV